MTLALILSIVGGATPLISVPYVLPALEPQRIAASKPTLQASELSGKAPVIPEPEGGNDQPDDKQLVQELLNLHGLRSEDVDVLLRLQMDTLLQVTTAIIEQDARNAQHLRESHGEMYAELEETSTESFTQRVARVLDSLDEESRAKARDAERQERRNTI